MLLYVNDVMTEAPPGLTILALLRWKGLEPGRIVVARNQEIVPCEAWDSVALAAEDRLDIVNFVGGG